MQLHSEQIPARCHISENVDRGNAVFKWKIISSLRYLKPPNCSVVRVRSTCMSIAEMLPLNSYCKILSWKNYICFQKRNTKLDIATCDMNFAVCKTKNIVQQKTRLSKKLCSSKHLIVNMLSRA